MNEAGDECKAAVRRLVAAFNVGDIDGVDAVLSPNLADWRQHLEELMLSQPPVRVVIDHLISEGDRLVEFWHVDADVSDSERQRGINLFRIRDGRIVEQSGFSVITSRS